MNVRRRRVWATNLVVVSLLGIGFNAISTAGPAGASGGGTLNVGFTAGIPQLNPALVTFSVEETLFPLLWDGLTMWNSKGKIAPDLATSWSSSAHNQTWTFNLRSGVKFSNGVAVTSADVVSSFNYYLNPSTPFQDNTGLSVIKSVTANGANSVVIQLKDPNASFPDAVTPVKVIDMAALSTIDTNPIGTGPFIVQSFVPNSTLTLVHNPNYWGSPASVSQINFTTEPDATAGYTALTAGTLQVMGQVPDSELTGAKANSSLKIVAPANPGSYLTWETDTKAGPFKNVKARQALAYAINAKAVLSEAYFGAGKVSTEADPLSTTNPFYDGKLTKYTYNLKKAKALFAEAGIHKGATFTWWTTSAYPEWTTAGQILQASLANIGIHLKIVSNDVSTWAAKFYPAGKSYPGLIIPNFQSVSGDPVFAMTFYAPGRCECNFNSSAIAAAYKTAVGSTNTSVQSKNWDSIQKILNQEVPTETPLQIATDSIVSSTVSGVWEESGNQLHLEAAVIKG
ncbi:MAG TPA: ABC transporter substrate-binding protein [Acidimicrobiales bacterium]|nr:ABC transporter substrate-binding protein [Acidimicrobiales bacterium]